MVCVPNAAQVVNRLCKTVVDDIDVSEAGRADKSREGGLGGGAWITGAVGKQFPGAAIAAAYARNPADSACSVI